MNKLAGVAVGLSLLAFPLVTFASSTVTASAGTGATVSPAGVTVVGTGVTQTFTFGASQGYTLSNVTVDGVSQGAVTSLGFIGLANSTDSIVASATAAGGGSMPWCSGAMAPGWHVDQIGGGCGSVNTFVAYNHPLADGTLCAFNSGCMVENR